jgi:hypothetical protein
MLPVTTNAPKAPAPPQKPVRGTRKNSSATEQQSFPAFAELAASLRNSVVEFPSVPPAGYTLNFCDGNSSFRKEIASQKQTKIYL